MEMAAADFHTGKVVNTNKMTPSTPDVVRYVVVVAVCWSLLVGASLWWNLWRSQESALEHAMTQARIAFEKDVLYRSWNALHGGLYAPVANDTQPNPYLDVKERDIKTPSGRLLTLVNPAYMTRQVHELHKQQSGVLGHITSLNPLRPGNRPDEWEATALAKLHQGAEEVWELKDIAGESYMRLMRPLITVKACLPCHASQGYKIGEIRGGISVSVPWQPVLSSLEESQNGIIITHALLWGLALVGLHLGSKHLRLRIKERDEAYQQREQALLDRQAALADVKQLRGLLPICANCKNIRNDQGYWNQLEEYITEHSEAEFSHSICPKCMEVLYPEIAKKIKYKEKPFKEV